VASKAPRCATVGTSCDSGTLLNGRGTRGPESNAPNTLASACADGNSGTYHVDESNDRIKVVSVSGAPLTAGTQVRVEATVWAYSTFSSDKLDLYYAANAASPSWTFLATLAPTAAGAQTLSATYTLPAGAMQAVRARFRYQGSAAACGTGNYNDHDDLSFAVQAP
jgi:leucyl aminopeptidase